MLWYIFLDYAKRFKNWAIAQLIKLLSDNFVLKRYEIAGKILGATLSDMHPVMGGQCDELMELFSRHHFWKQECARRGYKIIKMQAFIWWGGWGKKPEGFGEKA